MCSNSRTSSDSTSSVPPRSEADEIKNRVDEDIAEGKRNGVTGTPTLFVDGIRYDGAWDFYSMLEALERPVAQRVQRSARVFASLPASGGLVLLLAAALALFFANSPLAPYYRLFIESSFGIGVPAACCPYRSGRGSPRASSQSSSSLLGSRSGAR